jgi:hypothetical protein
MKRLKFCIISLFSLLVFNCPSEDKYTSTQSGNLNASLYGEIIFEFRSFTVPKSPTCIITIYLPEPNTFSLINGNEKRISGLQANQVVKWSATVEIGGLNARKEDNKVHLSAFMLE